MATVAQISLDDFFWKELEAIYEGMRPLIFKPGNWDDSDWAINSECVKRFVEVTAKIQASRNGNGRTDTDS